MSEQQPAPPWDYQPIAQFAVKLMGVYFAIDAVITFVGSGFQLLIGVWQEWSYAGEVAYGDAHVIAWLIALVPQFAIGISMAAGGEWFMDKVFTSGSDRG